MQPRGPDVSGVILTSLSVLSAAQCARWAAEVVALERYWTRREAEVPSFTLGLAAYLDVAPRADQAGSRPPYRIDAYRRWNNGLLRTHFGELLDQCCEAISAWSNLPTQCEDRHAALPGFHIHLPHPLFAAAVASKHIDIQFRQVFGVVEPDPASVLTFTLPVSMPQGAALRIWNHDDHAVDHAYRLGAMTIHDGLRFHQAILNPHHLPVPRIMLQGHGIRTDTGWRLYW